MRRVCNAGPAANMVPTRKIAGTAVQALWTATEKRARTAAFQTSAHPIVGRSARSAKRGPTTLPVTMPAPKTQITKGTACSGMPATWMRVGVAVEATGRKRLVIAGLWTGACAAFNVIEGLRRGYEVFFVADACGDSSIQAHERAVDRMIQAGAVPTTAQHFVYELQQDWGRQETYQGVMDIMKAHTAFGTQIFFSKWALGGRDSALKAPQLTAA